MANLKNSLTEMEHDYHRVAQLTETLDYDRQIKTRVKKEVDELAAEIAAKSAQKDILDKKLEKVSKQIEANEKTLATAEQRIKSFDLNYKKEEEAANNEEAAGKVGEYECPICKEICGNEQKQMVCITTCGHRFCKDCIDRVTALNEREERLRERLRLHQGLHQRRRQPFHPGHAGLGGRGDVIDLLPEGEAVPGENDIADPAPQAAALPAPQAPALPAPQAAAPQRHVFIPLLNNAHGHGLRPEDYVPRYWHNNELHVPRRCPTCQKHFSKKHVLRLY